MERNKKHAYLIMAHHRLDLLQLLIDSIDDYRNDIYIHIDIKCKENISNLKIEGKKSKITIYNELDVRWAGFSQVECEFFLLKKAVSQYDYSYIHLMTGATYPLFNQNYIHDFFENNEGKEFVGFSKNININRVKYVYLFNEIGKIDSTWKELLRCIRSLFIRIQNLIKYDRTKKLNITIMKGFAYWSITCEAAKYVISKYDFVNELLKYSVSGDEIFMQTLLYNSKFKNNIYSYEDEYEGCKRLCFWESRKMNGCNFIKEDFDDILKSEALFALKFEDKDGIDLIKKIADERNINI